MDALHPLVHLTHVQLHQQLEFSADQLLTLCQSEQVVAVGETGLDYFYSPDNKTTQQAAFAEQQFTNAVAMDD